MKAFMIRYLGVGILSFFCCSIFAQTTVEIEANADARVWKFQPNTNFGSSTYIQTYPWEASHTERFLLNFDLSSIPAGATISEAKITLNNSGTFGATRTLDLHKMNSSWTESGVTWNSSDGAFQIAPSAVAQPTFPLNVDAEWIVTSDVQSIVNGTTLNNGWLVKDSNEDGSQQFWRFDSRESTITENRPRISVTYSGGGNGGGGSPTGKNHTLTIGGAEDATISAFQNTQNFGGEDKVSTYPWGTQYSKRFTIQFDLSSLDSLPIGTNINKATLVLTSVNSFGVGRIINAHQITSSWDESSINWNSLGNNYRNSPTSSTMVSSINQSYEWDVTEDILNYVFINSDSHGWLLKDSIEDQSQSFWEFASNQNQNQAIRPVLLIDYELPLREVWCRTTDTTLLDPFKSLSYVQSVGQAFPFANTPALREIYKVAFYGNSDSIPNVLLNDSTHFSTVYEVPQLIPLYEPSDEYWDTPSPYLPGANILWHLEKIEADKAWDITRGRSEITVGVIDSDFDLTHPDLVGKFKSPKDNYTGEMHETRCGRSHGTGVASMLSTVNDGGGKLAAVGFNVSMLGYTTAGWPQKIVYASTVDKCDVINFSHMSADCPPEFINDVDLIVDEVIGNGTIIVQSAGNGYQGSFQCMIGGNWVETGPFLKAYNDGIIRVASSDKFDNHSHYLSTGANATHHNFPEVDICAPGYEVTTAAPSLDFDCDPRQGDFLYRFNANGSSYAAPIVSGVCALMKSVHPCLRPADAVNIIKATADPIQDENLYPGRLGAGRINAFKAVEAAKLACNVNINGIITSSVDFESYCSVYVDGKFTSSAISNVTAREVIYFNTGFEMEAGSNIVFKLDENFNPTCTW